MDDDAPAGVPEWVVTYGDMMSLLLTFFIMLVSLSEVAAEEKYRAVLEALQQYIGYHGNPVAPPGKHFPMNSLVRRLESLGSFTDNHRGIGGVRDRSLPGLDTRVHRLPEGTEAIVTRPIEFPVTSTSLPEDAGAQMAEIVTQCAGIPNKIEIRGNSSVMDDTPHAARLVVAYERARSVREYLLKKGIEGRRLRITAEVSEKPVGATLPTLADRVDVYVLDMFAEQYIGPRAAGP